VYTLNTDDVSEKPHFLRSLWRSSTLQRKFSFTQSRSWTLALVLLTHYWRFIQKHLLC